MKHTHFLKTNICRGFTLIELLVAVAIIGLLSTFLGAPIQNLRNKARDSKKVADVRNIRSALLQYAQEKETFPDTLEDLFPFYLETKLSNFTAGHVPQTDKYMYVIYEDTGSDNAITGKVNYAYHLVVKLQIAGNHSLDSDADCMGAGDSSLGIKNCAEIASNSGLDTTLLTVTNYVSTADPGAPSQAVDTIFPYDDFTASLTENSGTICDVTATSCLYDVRGKL